MTAESCPGLLTAVSGMSPAIESDSSVFTTPFILTTKRTSTNFEIKGQIGTANSRKCFIVNASNSRQDDNIFILVEVIIEVARIS